MAETKRDKATLLANLADNQAAAVTPEHVRDLLESLDASRSAYYWTNNTTTTFTLQGSGGPGGSNFYKLNGNTSGKTNNRFSVTQNRATYNGAPNLKVDAFCAFSFSMDGGPYDIAFEFYHNGVSVPSSYQVVRAGGAGEIVHISMMAEVTGLVSGDYIEVWAANESAANRVFTPKAGYVNIQEMAIA